MKYVVLLTHESLYYTKCNQHFKSLTNLSLSLHTIISQPQYKFIVEDNIALPVDPSFWDYLISSSQTQWGLMVYEQDWLDNQFPRTKALLVRAYLQWILNITLTGYSHSYRQLWVWVKNGCSKWESQR